MIYNKMKDIIEDADLTQNDMAKMINTSQANYSRWETSKEFIPLKKLIILCNYFNINMDYVLGISKIKKENKISSINKKRIGKNLKNLRKTNSVSQKDLAKLLNTTQSTISAYESGKTILLTAFAVEIVKKYNVSLEWLCNKND